MMTDSEHVALADRLVDAADLIACESQCSDPLTADLYAAAALIERVDKAEALLDEALGLLDDLANEEPGSFEERGTAYWGFKEHIASANAFLARDEVQARLAAQEGGTR